MSSLPLSLPSTRIPSGSSTRYQRHAMHGTSGEQNYLKQKEKICLMTVTTRSQNKIENEMTAAEDVTNSDNVPVEISKLYSNVQTEKEKNEKAETKVKLEENLPAADSSETDIPAERLRRLEAQNEAIRQKYPKKASSGGIIDRLDRLEEILSNLVVNLKSSTNTQALLDSNSPTPLATDNSLQKIPDSSSESDPTTSTSSYSNHHRTQKKLRSKAKNYSSSSSDSSFDSKEKKIKYRPMINKFDGDNYDEWIIESKFYMQDLKLWDKKKNLPVKGRKSFRELCFIIKFDQRIQLNLKGECGRKAYQILIEIYERPSLENSNRELSNLLQMQWDPTTSINTFITAVLKQRVKLQRLGCELAESTQVIKQVLLQGIPKEPVYVPWIRSMETEFSEQLSLEKFLNKLRELKPRESQKPMVFQAATPQVSFKSTQGSSLKPALSRDPSKNHMKCSFCQKTGHSFEKCIGRIAGLEAEVAKLKSQTPATANCAVATANLQEWIVDTGANIHVTHTLSLLTDVTPDLHIPITIAKGNPMTATATGTATILTGDGLHVTLRDVHFVSGASRNLISPQMLTNDYRIILEKKVWHLESASGRILTGTINDHGLYALVQKSANLTLSLQDVHRRMGHIAKSTIKTMISKDLLPFTIKPCEDTQCIACIQGKTPRSAISKKSTSPDCKLERLVCDIFGPTPVKSYSGNYYFITFIDDRTNMIFKRNMATKNEASSALDEIISLIRTQYGKTIQVLFSDNAKELCQGRFNDICVSHGILREYTAPYSSFQNGKAERFNRTIMDLSRAMLADNNLSPALWDYASDQAVIILNNTLSTVKNFVPSREYGPDSRPFGYTELLPFGQPLMVKILSPLSKLDSRCQPGKYVGYDTQRKAVKVLLDDSLKVVPTRDFTLLHSDNSLNNISTTPILDPKNINDTSTIDLDLSPKTINENSTGDFDMPIADLDDRESNPIIQFGNESLIRNSKNQLIDSLGNSVELVPYSTYRPAQDILGEPKNVRRTVKKPNYVLGATQTLDATKKFQSRQKEINAIVDNGTYDLVPRPMNIPILPCHFVDTIKLDQNEIPYYKSRLVAGGDKQELGINYSDVFAPTLKSKSVRMLIVIAVQKKWHMRQIDFCSAFLNAPLTEEIFMYQPPGFNDGSGRVCKLNKSLYGLKQAPRLWNQLVVQILTQRGFIQMKSDTSIFRHSHRNIIVGCYVDDCILIGQVPKELQDLEDDLALHYKIKKLGPLKKLIALYWKHDTLLLEQTLYTQDLLRSFSENLRESKTPAQSEDKKEFSSFADVNLFQRLVGSLTYLAVNTRPDISFATSKLAERMSAPSEKDWKNAQLVLRYLRFTINTGISYRSASSAPTLVLDAYADADYANCSLTRQSRTGYVIRLCGVPISWSAIRQKCVTLSTTEAEFVAATESAKELLWFKHLLDELQVGMVETPVQYCDNKSTIAIAHDPVNHQKTKHIDVRYYWLREQVNDGLFILNYIPTTDMLADLLTKALPGPAVQRLRSQLNLES